MKKFLLVLACLFGSSAMAASPVGCEAPTGQTRDAVIRVSGDDGSQGSGVVVAQDLVLTAAHVVVEAEHVFVGYDDRIRKAAVLMADESKDLALLAAPTGRLQPLAISRRIPMTWQPVWAVGFPLALEQVATPGFYEQLYNGGLKTTADVQSGQSGGALVSCERGRQVLTGIVRGFGAYQTEGGGYERIADFSISVTPMDIWNFMEAGAMTAMAVQ